MFYPLHDEKNCNYIKQLKEYLNYCYLLKKDLLDTNNISELTLYTFLLSSKQVGVYSEFDLNVNAKSVISFIDYISSEINKYIYINV